MHHPGPNKARALDRPARRGPAIESGIQIPCTVSFASHFCSTQRATMVAVTLPQPRPHFKVSVPAVLFLSSVLVLQWIGLTVLLTRQGCSDQNAEAAVPQQKAVVLGSPVQQAEPAGVAATVLFRAPRWFHLRYTFMLHNVLSNLPPDWTLQVFINQEWVEKDVLPWHPALKRLLKDDPRIHVVPLPDRFVQKKAKPKQVLLDPWFWEQVGCQVPKRRDCVDSRLRHSCWRITSFCSREMAPSVATMIQTFGVI